MGREGRLCDSVSWAGRQCSTLDYCAPSSSPRSQLMYRYRVPLPEFQSRLKGGRPDPLPVPGTGSSSPNPVLVGTIRPESHCHVLEHQIR
jgi:hypothetical protein